METRVAASGVSAAFEAFGRETPEHARAWMQATDGLAQASALEDKTHHLAYIAVLAAVGAETGMAFHAALARAAGASREEVASAVLVGLQPAGHTVIASLPAALAGFDAAGG
jgi:alkylhydroperoxidase/carboxymuconolactone decarboxylase family protein YurZ